jgi:hypothetical protein
MKSLAYSDIASQAQDSLLKLPVSTLFDNSEAFLEEKGNSPVNIKYAIFPIPQISILFEYGNHFAISGDM